MKFHEISTLPFGFHEIALARTVTYTKSTLVLFFIPYSSLPSDIACESLDGLREIAWCARRAAAAALEGIARNPQASGKLFTPMIIGLALIESLVIYALVIAFILSGNVG